MTRNLKILSDVLSFCCLYATGYIRHTNAHEPTCTHTQSQHAYKDYVLLQWWTVWPWHDSDTACHHGSTWWCQGVLRSFCACVCICPFHLVCFSLKGSITDTWGLHCSSRFIVFFITVTYFVFRMLNIITLWQRPILGLNTTWLWRADK